MIMQEYHIEIVWVQLFFCFSLFLLQILVISMSYKYYQIKFQFTLDFKRVFLMLTFNSNILFNCDWIIYYPYFKIRTQVPKFIYYLTQLKNHLLMDEVIS